MKKTCLRSAAIGLILLAATTVLAGEGEEAASGPSTSPSAFQAALCGKDGALTTLEKKLLGTWYGPACGGDYTFNSDGTFDLKHFTPGGNTVTGTWSLRWDALPPTLVLMCKTSDFTKKDPSRDEYKYVGNALELKLLELDSDTFTFRLPKDKGDESPNDKRERRYKRRVKE